MKIESRKADENENKRYSYVVQCCEVKQQTHPVRKPSVSGPQVSDPEPISDPPDNGPPVSGPPVSNSAIMIDKKVDILSREKTQIRDTGCDKHFLQL